MNNAALQRFKRVLIGSRFSHNGKTFNDSRGESSVAILATKKTGVNHVRPAYSVKAEPWPYKNTRVTVYTAGAKIVMD